MDENLLFHGVTSKPEDFLKPEAPQHSEIAGSAIFPLASWTEKTVAQFYTYPKRNQNQQYSCVQYTLAKQLSIDEFSENGVWRELSPHSTYPFVVVPGGGSDSIVSGNLAVKQGMTLEALFPTDGLTEAQVEDPKGYYTDAKMAALIYKPDAIVQCAHDFETIASILQTYKKLGQRKAVSVCIQGQNNGTWYSTFPQPPSNTNTNPIWAHQIPIVDFGTINGKKYLAFDNSAGEMVGNKGQQFLGEEYLPFMYGGMYTLNKPDDWQQTLQAIKAPKYSWNVDLKIGSIGPDVFALQQALQSLGMFPTSKFIQPTGNFAGITHQSVILFQQSFALPVTGIVDITTRTKLNEIFVS